MTADPARIAADQATQLPGTPCEGGSCEEEGVNCRAHRSAVTPMPDTPTLAVVVPDEAVSRFWAVYADPAPTGNRLRDALAAAAPAIVAANQPKADDGLRRVVQGALWNASGLPDWYVKAALGRDFTPLVDRILPAVEAYVAAQVTVARAGERGRLTRVLAESMDDTNHLMYANETDEQACGTCRQAMQQARRALGVDPA